jgi:ABC-2 type transport system permease protein
VVVANLETVLVLGAWAMAGLLVTPALLRRMAGRQSGSQVEAATHEATQWVR